MMSPAELTPEQLKEIEEFTEKLKVVRLQLAKKNQIVAKLQRQLDDVPNRAEMAQYQRRFLELYNQGKHYILFIFLRKLLTKHFDLSGSKT